MELQLQKWRPKASSSLLSALVAISLCGSWVAAEAKTNFDDRKNYYYYCSVLPSLPSCGAGGENCGGNNCGSLPSIKPTLRTPPSSPSSSGVHVGVSPPSTGSGPHEYPTMTPPTTTPVMVPPPPPVAGTPYFPVGYPCIKWRSQMSVVLDVFVRVGTIGKTFGVMDLPGNGELLTLEQALANRSADEYGSLYRESTAALLHSLLNDKFAFTTKQVRNLFADGLVSSKAASDVEQIFKLANEALR